MSSEASTGGTERYREPTVEELRRELAEARRREAATAEVLRVISTSAADVQPVFDTIVRSAVTLCNGGFSGLFQFDGELVHLVAQHNWSPEALEEAIRIFPAPPNRVIAGCAILKRAVVHVPDVELDPELQHAALPRAIGWRGSLFVPMLRDGDPIGAIVVTRSQPGHFSDSEIELLKTFADQAVIAIENKRLFEAEQARTREVTERTHALAEALHHQTATSEVLNVISRSPTNLQPVFDTIVKSAVRLCGALLGALYKFDGELLHVVAHHNYTPEALNALQRVYPARPSRALFTARSILERAVVHIPDVEAHDPDHKFQALSRAISVRSGLYVPMLREGSAIGVIAGEATSLRSSPRICAPLLRAWLQTRAPGRPANRQRAPAQRVARGAAAADRHRRCAKSHQPLGV